MSGLLFIVAVDWIMSRATEDARRGIRWTPFTQLEDLDYADDIAALSHTAAHIQQKTDRIAEYGEQIGLTINNKKTKVMTVNVDRKANIIVRGEAAEEVQTFSYLGSTVAQDGGTEADIQARLGKARQAFARLTPVWRSSEYSRQTKVKIFSSCVISVLLYGSECWRMTQRDIHHLSVFQMSCLRKICRIFWPEKISNSKLLERTAQEPIIASITRRRWRWVGHTLRRDSDNITRTALRWTPEGKRRRGRPKTTWRRTLETEAQSQNKSWKDLETLAKDRHSWSDLVAALCATTRRKEDE